MRFVLGRSNVRTVGASDLCLYLPTAVACCARGRAHAGSVVASPCWALLWLTNNVRVKRAFDVFLVLVAAPFWLPLVLVASLLVRGKLGKPVFFRQRRPGRNGVMFELWKFRTMTEARDTQGRLLPDAERLTFFGRWLRSTSLDELPELFNVLRGEMSLVGPRPLLVEYLERYTPGQARRHEVRPGITGWAQINGRNAITWEQKFELDVWYVDHLSWRLDVKIIMSTIWKTLKREDINQPGQATAQEFMGRKS